MRNQDENYYDILSVARTATQEEIKKAWRKKAFEFHPDRGGSDKMMFKINWAYEQLSNPESRRNYDRSNTYQQQTNKERPHQQQKTNNTHAKKEPREEAPENYDNAVFVDGIGIEFISQVPEVSGRVAVEFPICRFFFPICLGGGREAHIHL